MVPGSRRILSLFCKVQVSAVPEVQQAEKKAHQSVGVDPPVDSVRNAHRKQPATSQNKNPTEKDIDAAMNGNLCRCGTYLRIRKAIQLAAEIQRKGI